MDRNSNTKFITSAIIAVFSLLSFLAFSTKNAYATYDPEKPCNFPVYKTKPCTWNAEGQADKALAQLQNAHANEIKAVQDAGGDCNSSSIPWNSADDEILSNDGCSEQKQNKNCASRNGSVSVDCTCPVNDTPPGDGDDDGDGDKGAPVMCPTQICIFFDPVTGICCLFGPGPDVPCNPQPPGPNPKPPVYPPIVIVPPVQPPGGGGGEPCKPGSWSDDHVQCPLVIIKVDFKDFEPYTVNADIGQGNTEISFVNQPDAPMLVDTTLINGTLKSAIFGNFYNNLIWKSGFHALKSKDINNDGIISLSESATLAEWVDSNHDGKIDKIELTCLNTELSLIGDYTSKLTSLHQFQTLTPKNKNFPVLVDWWNTENVVDAVKLRPLANLASILK